MSFLDDLKTACFRTNVPQNGLLYANLDIPRADGSCLVFIMLDRTASTFSVKDASHSLMEEISPEPFRLWVLVRDESDLVSCPDAVVCWVIDRAPVLRTS